MSPLFYLLVFAVIGWLLYGDPEFMALGLFSSVGVAGPAAGFGALGVIKYSAAAFFQSLFGPVLIFPVLTSIGMTIGFPALGAFVALAYLLMPGTKKDNVAEEKVREENMQVRWCVDPDQDFSGICSGRGRCHSNYCACDEGYTGRYCEAEQVPEDVKTSSEEPATGWWSVLQWLGWAFDILQVCSFIQWAGWTSCVGTAVGGLVLFRIFAQGFA